MKTGNELRNDLYQRQRKQRGYSLVETMIAVVIGAMGISGLSTAVTHADRLGDSAGQSGAITMAFRSTFSQLRLALSDNATPGAAYQFQSDRSNAASSASPLNLALQQQITQLTNSIGETRLAINCGHMSVPTCEVCFDWYDNASSVRNLADRTISLGVTNRSICQIQIV